MSKSDWRPVSEILAMLGMSQEEGVEYLRARGLKVSYGAIKAWGRGHYATPEDAIEELWRLWLAVSHAEEYAYDMPDEAPASARARAEIIVGLGVWFKARDPDDPEAALDREDQEMRARGEHL